MYKDYRTVKPYEVRFQDADARGRIHLHRLLDYAQDCDEINCGLLGADTMTLYRAGACWILLGQSVRFEGDLPVGGDKILVESWSLGARGVRFYRENRYYRNRLDEDHCFGRSTSEWIVCSLDDHRPLRPSTALDMDDFSKKSEPGSGSLEKMPPLRPLAGADLLDPVLSCQVAYGDLDFNRHLHNTHYCRLAIDAAASFLNYDPGRDLLVPKALDIRFISETAYREVLDILVQKDPACPTGLLIQGRARKDGRETFLASLDIRAEDSP